MKIKKLDLITYFEILPSITIYFYPYSKKYSVSFSWLKYGFILIF